MRVVAINESNNYPSPLVGEGREGGPDECVLGANASPIDPHPNPSPQGGGEQNKTRIT
jgi:hypothetical protein